MPHWKTLRFQEISDRLAAYRSGEIKVVALSDVIAKSNLQPSAHEHPLARARASGTGRRHSVDFCFDSFLRLSIKR